MLQIINLGKTNNSGKWKSEELKFIVAPIFKRKKLASGSHL
jgi:hypothetical protein